MAEDPAPTPEQKPEAERPTPAPAAKAPPPLVPKSAPRADNGAHDGMTLDPGKLASRHWGDFIKYAAGGIAGAAIMGYLGYRDVREELKQVRQRLEDHLTFVEKGFATKEGSRLSEYASTRDGGITFAPALPSADAPRDKWSGEFKAARERFCANLCGGEYPETACHEQCRRGYLSCGVDNRADPNDPGFRDCIKQIKAVGRDD